MVARRVAADHEYAVCCLQVVELDRRGAAYNDAGEAHTAGLMAVEAAIVDVVRAVKASKELEQEARFVAAAAAEVPECFVRRNRSQLARNVFQRFLPGDRR